MCVVTGIQGTEYTAGLLCGLIITEDTHDVSCDMLLNLGAC
jgi:hypothetical protein